MKARFAECWGWPLITVMAMAADWLAWRRLSPHAILPGTAMAYLGAVLLLGRLSAHRRWRWVWAIAGLAVGAWGFGTDFTGTALWVCLAAWRRPAWDRIRGRAAWGTLGWVAHV